MKIRQAAEQDFDAVRHITRTTIETVYPHYYPAGAVAFFLAHHNDAAIRRDILESRVFLCISEDNIPAGTVTVHENEIGRLFVLPEHQGKGYGRELLAFAEKIVAEHFAEAVLDVSLSAKAIYLRHGYLPTGYHTIAAENGDFLCYDTMKKRVST